MPKTSVPRLSREERQAQTRQHLIEAACEQVAARGFEAASVRDIAKAAGYTLGAFYSNFESKEALLLDLLRLHKAEEAERVHAAVEGAGADFEAALAALEAWARGFGMAPQQALLATELHLHAARHPAFGVAYAQVMAEQRRLYGELLERLFSLGRRPPPAAPEALAASLMALARSLAVDHALHGAAAPGEILVAVIRAMFRG